ncbi:hypothetical protein ACSOV8_12365 [Bacillus halotolerans]|uniref:hypothetical protein n=1 Tax=Bacillus halotolerans TaxID=260554 RepID=UPI00403F56B7
MKLFLVKKKFEYRKQIFKRDDISSVVVYATKPFGKVVGEFDIETILIDNPDIIWTKTKDYSGITYKYFKNYFKGKRTGFAIQIKNFKQYDMPLDLNEFDNKIKVAPQSFCYTEGGL